MIRLINRLLNKSKNLAFIVHKRIVTLEDMYLRQLHQNLPRGEFFKLLNSVYFDDKSD